MKSVYTATLMFLLAIPCTAQSNREKRREKHNNSSSDMPYVECARPDERTQYLISILTKNDTNKIGEFLNAGINVNQCWDNDNNLSILWYIIDRCNKNTLGFVLRHGADPNLRVRRKFVKMFTGEITGYGFSEYPLETAAGKGDVDKFDLLIQYGADLNRCKAGVQNKAAQSGNMALINYLNKTAGVSNVGKNALAIMTDQSYEHDVRKVTPDVIEQLVSSGADVNSYSKTTGRTALLNVILNNDIKNKLELAKTLIKHHADVNKKDNPTSGFMKVYPMSPLRAAMQIGDLNIVKLLVENGANVNEVVDEGRNQRVLSSPCNDAIREYLILHGAK